MNIKQIAFFTGQGCQNMGNLLLGKWQELFLCIPLLDSSFRKQAAQRAEGLTGTEGMNHGVVMGHSAGCLVALFHALHLMSMGVSRTRKIVLLAPPPLLGTMMPVYLVWQMMKNPRYWLKCLPWAKPFRLDRKDSDRLMFGPDTPGDKQGSFHEQHAKEWFPRLIAENTFSFLCPWLWPLFFNWKRKLAGIEIVVIGGDGYSDRMIPEFVSRKTAGRLGATYVPFKDASHLGMFVGEKQEALANLLQQVIAADYLATDSASERPEAMVPAKLVPAAA